VIVHAVLAIESGAFIEDRCRRKPEKAAATEPEPESIAPAA